MDTWWSLGIWHGRPQSPAAAAPFPGAPNNLTDAKQRHVKSKELQARWMGSRQVSKAAD